jgi:hypothetical protein
MRVQEEEILIQLRNAIAELQNKPVGAEVSFMRAQNRSCHLQKVAEDGASLYLGGPTDSLWLSDAADELAGLITDRIVEKAHRLEGIDRPKILILDDRYPFSELRLFRQLPISSAPIEKFHCIYVARHDRQSILLRSEIGGLSGVWD